MSLKDQTLSSDQTSELPSIKKKNFSNSYFSTSKKDSLIFTSVAGDSSFLEKGTQQYLKHKTEEDGWRSSLSSLFDEKNVWASVSAQEYIKNICKSVVRVTGIEHDCWITSSLSPQISAHPGGVIFVSPGFLALVKDEDTLVFFLAHEAGHSLLRHVSKKFERSEKRRELQHMFGLISILTIQKSVPVSRFDLQDLLIQTVFEDELEADKVGLLVALQLGKSPAKILNGMKELQEKLDELSENQTQNNKDYPQWQIRLDRLRALSENYRIQSTPESGEGQSHSEPESIQTLLRAPFANFRFQLKTLIFGG